MRTDQKECLLQSIRAGTVYHKNLKIVPATIDQNLKSCNIYTQTYDDCLNSGIMTEDFLEDWMIENGLLPQNFASSKKKFISDIDEQKLSMYHSRFEPSKVGRIRYVLNELRSKLNDLLGPKFSYSQNTCEFIANLEKQMFLVKETAFYKDKKYKGSNFNRIFAIWQDSLLPEKTIRLLARSDLWKSISYQNKYCGYPLFVRHKAPNTDLTMNQRNLLAWSGIYDNVSESMDCPEQMVIDDDDMLDGWFLEQKKKREKQKKEDLLESRTKNSKISSSQHVMLAPSRDLSAEDIVEMNDGISELDLLQYSAGLKHE